MKDATLELPGVMSSCLCKNSEGAVFPVAHTPAHTAQVDEADHVPGRRRTSTTQRSLQFYLYTRSRSLINIVSTTFRCNKN
jgi:hypothetical protein